MGVFGEKHTMGTVRIREEYQISQTKTEDDIMLLRARMQKSKGINP